MRQLLVALTVTVSILAAGPVSAEVGDNTPCAEPGLGAEQYCGATPLREDKSCALGKVYQLTLQAKAFSEDPDNDYVMLTYRQVSMYSPFARSRSSRDFFVSGDGTWQNIRRKTHWDSNAYIHDTSGSVMQLVWWPGILSFQLRLWGRCVPGGGPS